MLADLLRRLLRRPTSPGVLERAAALDPETLRLVVGLGNPGDGYAATRHNLGFLVVDRLAEHEWSDAGRGTQSLVSLAPCAGMTLVLAQPRTYMNRSGLAVHALLDALSLDTSRALVVYDDMDLPLGSLRLRERGSAGTHNGMRSVVAEVGPDIPRLRIGIGQAAGAPARDYVLSGFTPEEAEIAERAVAEAAEAVRVWATEGAVAAMNRFNRAVV
jgi:peptidyl-tRNA hydrolase, PTH1 family